MPFMIEPRGYDDADVVRLVAEVQAEYVTRYGGPDAATVEVGEFSPPSGRFLVGLLDGAPVATGGWRRLEPDAAEIKRMYVAPRARRRGLARLMLVALEESAAESGIRRILLNTGPGQPEAVALYENAGYQPTAGFGNYACHPGALFFAKDLGADPGSRSNPEGGDRATKMARRLEGNGPMACGRSAASDLAGL